MIFPPVPLLSAALSASPPTLPRPPSSFPSLKPHFPPQQMNKQNDKESARDMSGFKPANFDRSFKAGKGWGDMGVSLFYALKWTHDTRKCTHVELLPVC